MEGFGCRSVIHVRASLAVRRGERVGRRRRGVASRPRNSRTRIRAGLDYAPETIFDHQLQLLMSMLDLCVNGDLPNEQSNDLLALLGSQSLVQASQKLIERVVADHWRGRRLSKPVATRLDDRSLLGQRASLLLELLGR